MASSLGGWGPMVHSLTPMVAISTEKIVFWNVAIDRERHLVRIARTEAPLTQLADIPASFAQLDRALADVGRKHFCLLIDLREGPRRNDAEFEANVDRWRKALVISFRRTAVLVKTAAGLLQVKRHLQEDRASHGAAFTSEAEAMRYLERGNQTEPR